MVHQEAAEPSSAPSLPTAPPASATPAPPMSPAPSIPIAAAAHGSAAQSRGTPIGAAGALAYPDTPQPVPRRPKDDVTRPVDKRTGLWVTPMWETVQIGSEAVADGRRQSSIDVGALPPAPPAAVATPKQVWRSHGFLRLFIALLWLSAACRGRGRCCGRTHAPCQMRTPPHAPIAMCQQQCQLQASCRVVSSVAMPLRKADSISPPARPAGVCNAVRRGLLPYVPPHPPQSRAHARGQRSRGAARAGNVGVGTSWVKS